MYTNSSRNSTGMTTMKRVIDGYRSRCLRLRRSIVAESASAVVIGVSPALVAGEGEEDVVEVWGVHGQLGDIDAVVVQDGQDSAQLGDLTAGGDIERERLLVGLARPRQQRLGRAEQARVGEPELDVAAGDHALELLRRARSDQLAVIQQRDLIGQLVGLLQVLRG